jgi:hypothetical protein
MCFRIKIHVDVDTVSYCHTRNKANGGKTNRSQSKYASRSLVVYHYEVLNTNSSRSGSPVCKRWQRLNAPFLKINCNGAFSPSSHSGVLGFVTRVMEGQVIAGVLGDVPICIMLTMLILRLQASR